jgi:hypothetical protein
VGDSREAGLGGTERAGHFAVAAIVASLPAAAAMWALGVGIGIAVWVVGTVAIGAYSISSASRGRR